MAPKYKLIYFNITGLGEPIRFLLSYGNIEFEDKRITHEEWAKLKDGAPLKQLPLLEVDGTVLFQSTAILRYLGNIIGIVGKTPLENWKIDAVSDTIGDIRSQFVRFYTEEDPEKKNSIKDKLINETFPLIFGKFEQWLEENNGYVAIAKLTWVDIYLAAIIGLLEDRLPKEFGDSSHILDKYPVLYEYYKKILNIPQIQAWLEKRPKTDK